MGSLPWPWSWKLPGMLALRSPRGAPSTTFTRNHRILRSPLHLQVWFLCAAWTLPACRTVPTQLVRTRTLTFVSPSVNGSSFTSGHSPSKEVRPAPSGNQNQDWKCKRIGNTAQDTSTGPKWQESLGVTPGSPGSKMSLWHTEGAGTRGRVSHSRREPQTPAILRISCRS